MSKIELPLGFGMALAQNESAMKSFEQLTEEKKQDVVQKTHSITSKSEMAAFVNSLASDTGF